MSTKDEGAAVGQADDESTGTDEKDVVREERDDTSPVDAPTDVTTEPATEPADGGPGDATARQEPAGQEADADDTSRDDSPGRVADETHEAGPVADDDGPDVERTDEPRAEDQAGGDPEHEADEPGDETAEEPADDAEADAPSGPDADEGAGTPPSSPDDGPGPQDGAEDGTDQVPDPQPTADAPDPDPDPEAIDAERDGPEDEPSAREDTGQEDTGDRAAPRDDGAEEDPASDAPAAGDPVAGDRGESGGEVGDDDAGDDPTGSAAASATEPGAWHRLGAALKPGFSRSQVLAGVLCAALGFALVVQVQQSSSDQLSSARQDDLVRLLDEVTDRAEQLSREVSQLETTRDELLSGSNKAASALELARERASSEGILSGRLPAEGPGVRLRITDPSGSLEAAQLFNVLEELRNAGAEVVALNGVRLITTTWFRDQDGQIVVDGHPLEAPYQWTVIGDPDTLDRALEIPGGALATVRNAGASASTTQRDQVTITEVREPAEPEHAEPRDDEG